jgi:nucleotide-binding universal stress UspA family protein
MSTGPFRPQRLLVPFDFGPAGERSLRVARALAAPQVHVVHVLQESGLFAWGGDDARRAQATDRLRAALAGTGLDRAVPHVVIGDVGEAVGALAGRLECDQVVLVAPPGSEVAEGVVRTAPCAVLVVRF